jgi:hypothetical protein
MQPCTSPQSCTICLAEFVQTDKVLKLECDHMFHSQCLLPWLSRQRSCPLCRYRIGAGPAGGQAREADEDSIRLARMLAHFLPRIVSTAGFIAPPPRRGYPTSTVNVTSNPYAHYRGFEAAAKSDGGGAGPGAGAGGDDGGGASGAKPTTSQAAAAAASARDAAAAAALRRQQAATAAAAMHTDGLLGHRA